MAAQHRARRVADAGIAELELGLPVRGEGVSQNGHARLPVVVDWADSNSRASTQRYAQLRRVRPRRRRDPWGYAPLRCDLLLPGAPCPFVVRLLRSCSGLTGCAEPGEEALLGPFEQAA